MKKKKTNMKRAESVAFCGLAIALLTVCSWVTVPFGPVPFTLQTMMLAFVVAAFPAPQAAGTVLGWLLLGAIGVPVFSGMSGGLASVMGPTGGFLIGFGVGVLLVALISKLWKEPRSGAMRSVREAVFAAAMLMSAYAFGWLQFMAVTGMGPLEAFAISIAPFVLLDVAKMAVGVSLAHALKAAVPALRRGQASRKA